MRETWKEIKKYRDGYEVSDFGRVRNMYTGLILKPSIISGYKVVDIGQLSKNNKKRRTTIHRLVAEAFVDNDYNKPYVNHIDSNKQNNHYRNLEWVTASENIRHYLKSKEPPKPKERKRIKFKKILCEDKLLKKFYFK